MTEVTSQAATLARRSGRVCLITSSWGDRWVLPKGHVEPGQTLTECAAAEAYEEAGLLGTPDPDPLGCYDYTKNGREYRVTVYGLYDFTELADWPEYFERVREWVTPAVAIERVREEGLRAILAGLT